MTLIKIAVGLTQKHLAFLERRYGKPAAKHAKEMWDMDNRTPGPFIINRVKELFKPLDRGTQPNLFKKR